MALENISAGSEEAALSNDVSSSNLDLGGVDNPLDSFSGLNLNAIETDDKVVNTLTSTDTPAAVTGEQAGPGPSETTPKKKLSMAEMQALHRKNVIKTQIYSKNLGAIASQSINQFEATKEYEFDTYKKIIGKAAEQYTASITLQSGWVLCEISTVS